MLGFVILLRRQTLFFPQLKAGECHLTPRGVNITFANFTTINVILGTWS